MRAMMRDLTLLTAQRFDNETKVDGSFGVNVYVVRAARVG